MSHADCLKTDHRDSGYKPLTMSFQLKENETILAKCTLQEFTATLTTFRLVINSQISEENFPLRGISGIGVYDDVDKYARDLKVEKEKIKQTNTIIGLAIGLLIGLVLMKNGQFFISLIAVSIGAATGSIIQTNTKTKVESILNIMQQGGSRQFRFYKNDSSAAEIKKLVDKVTDTLN